MTASNNQEVKSFANMTITVSSELTPEQLVAYNEGSKIILLSPLGETIELEIEDLYVNAIDWADKEKND